MVISNLERFAIVGKRAKSYIGRADVVGEEERLKTLGYNGWYNSREVNKFREVKDTSGTSYNKEMTRKKSIRKEEREIYLMSIAATRLLDRVFLVVCSGLSRARVL